MATRKLFTSPLSDKYTINVSYEPDKRLVVIASVGEDDTFKTTVTTLLDPDTVDDLCRELNVYAAHARADRANLAKQGGGNG